MAQNSRTRDLSLIVPVLGVFLLMTPFARIFDSTAPVWGIPLVALYVFVVWLGLILVAIGLARRLSGDDEDTADEPASHTEANLDLSGRHTARPGPEPSAETD